MRHISIDIETYSDVDIKGAGAYKYAQSPAFELLLFAYKIDDEPTVVIDLFETGGLPVFIIDILKSPDWIKHAYNAAFEWYSLNRLGFETPIWQWRCTMVHGMYLGYPAGLSTIGKAIGLPEDKRKMSVGTALINYFCKPCKPTKTNGGRTRNLPDHEPEKWKLFKEYNAQDVNTERAVLDRLEIYPMPAAEIYLWHRDTIMNAYGVRVDRKLITGARLIDSITISELKENAKRLTGLVNPNSNAQLLPWLQDRIEIENVQKATVSDVLSKEIPEEVRSVLEIRQQLGKTSTAKYTAMQEACGEGDRIRGLMQFYGATKTGRWAGRLVQVQNLPRNDLPALDTARDLVCRNHLPQLRLLYGNVSDTLSQLIRTAFIPSEGNKFVVADFSAIEARVIAWLAREEWVNEVFATHGKIYEATASQMFHVPIELIKKGNPEYALRQKGKVATLALGYQGGVNALTAMGALRMGLSEEELPEIVERWRQANPNIVRLWYSVEQAAVSAIETGGMHIVNGIVFRCISEGTYGQSFLTVQLPSGRKLFYPAPYLSLNQFGKRAVHFSAVNTARKWTVESTYGGKLVENIVQAIARDCLAVTLNRVWDRGLNIVFHVHDEVVIDAPQTVTVDEICDLMAEPIEWAPGLVLKGAGFESTYYKKD